MKRITLRTALVVLAAAASSCGSVCARIDSAQETFFAGKTECSSSSGGATVTIKRSSLQCNDEACPSESDQKALTAYADCLSKAPACTTGNEEAATNGGLACAVALYGGTSESCRTALAK